MQVIRIVQNIPKQVKLLLKIDKRCAAFSINSPGLHKKTQDILTNCDLMETASHLADFKKIGVFATRDIAPGDEFWTVYGDISVGQLKGRVLHQVTPMSKGERKKEEEGKVFGVGTQEGGRGSESAEHDTRGPRNGETQKFGPNGRESSGHPQESSRPPATNPERGHTHTERE
jgi:hypothetical protein